MLEDGKPMVAIKLAKRQRPGFFSFPLCGSPTSRYLLTKLSVLAPCIITCKYQGWLQV